MDREERDSAVIRREAAMRGFGEDLQQRVAVHRGTVPDRAMLQVG